MTGHVRNERHHQIHTLFRRSGDRVPDPVTQLVGFILTGDPTYITSYNNARSMICRLERDEILEELVRYYLQGHFPAR